MYPGVVLRHSHRLAGLLPSTYPPLLGETTRRSRRTNSHFDSHTMSDHEPEIPEIPYLPPLIWEVELSSTYGTSVGSSPSMAGTLPDDPSQFSGYMHANRQYWSCSLNHETHHAPTGTSTSRHGMPNIPETGPASHVGSGVDPGAAPGGTSIPFHAERFGNSHISPSTPAVGGPSHTHDLGLVLVFLHLTFLMDS